MSPDLLIKHFDCISEAPESIPRLRSFIYDLAVRGKLVDQDPNDEPASELLKRIQCKKGYHSSVFSAIREETIPFQLPFGWEWVRFGQIIVDADAGWSPKSEGFPRSGDKWGVLKISAVSWDQFLPDENKQLLPHVVPPERARVRQGDLLISRANTSELVAKCVVVEEEPKNLILSDKIVRLQIADNLSKRFICIVNNHAAHARSYYAKEASGTSLSMKNVSRAVIYALAFPLPPVQEQHRIVAKVDEFMALCDRLETAQAERNSRRHRLAMAALHHLSNGENSVEIRGHACFYLDHLSELTSHVDQMSVLRRTILDLAVHGRLVPQDPSEGSASELIKRIQAEKTQRIEEGGLRREKPLAPILEDEVPFAIPASWSWTRIGTCSLLTEYGTSVKSNQAEDGVPMLAMGNIKGGRIILDERRKVSRQIKDLPQLFLKKFDLLYNRTNSPELVGKTGIYLGEDDAYTFASYVIRIRFLNHLTSPAYLNIAMNAPYFRPTQIVPELRQQCGQANVNGSKLRNMIIPLPPFAEQLRIVAKIDELMTLCDRLDEQLTAVGSQSRDLLEAILNKALNDKRENSEQLDALYG